jgi:hypothetical protein
MRAWSVIAIAIAAAIAGGIAGALVTGGRLPWTGLSEAAEIDRCEMLARTRLQPGQAFALSASPEVDRADWPHRIGFVFWSGPVSHVMYCRFTRDGAMTAEIDGQFFPPAAVKTLLGD